MKIFVKNQTQRDARARDVLAHFDRFLRQCVAHSDCVRDFDLGVACGKGPLGKGVQAIRWEQYTPYFNDGGSCTFRISDFRWKLFKPDAGFRCWSDTENDSDFNSIQEAIYTELSEICNNFELEVNGTVFDIQQAGSGTHTEVARAAFLNAFGDHATVTITREGAVVEEYAHE